MKNYWREQANADTKLAYAAIRASKHKFELFTMNSVDEESGPVSTPEELDEEERALSDSMECMKSYAGDYVAHEVVKRSSIEDSSNTTPLRRPITNAAFSHAAELSNLLDSHIKAGETGLQRRQFVMQSLHGAENLDIDIDLRLQNDDKYKVLQKIINENIMEGVSKTSARTVPEAREFSFDATKKLAGSYCRYVEHLEDCINENEPIFIAKEKRDGVDNNDSTDNIVNIAHRVYRARPGLSELKTLDQIVTDWGPPPQLSQDIQARQISLYEEAVPQLDERSSNNRARSSSSIGY